ncbi:MAG TPA: response regulator transcription factor [Saprospiraceae bacterium]|nr:response regulator transcription factor [Saprospiraceae bacterium]MCB9329235.1 response regulator transcription factor [Lewinellaceae bacterium]HPK10366.1 response regulator transcription factor [Saprospiraceae bacterium]HRX28209.1 response regulator transcription factor [Saprospiraceae bacterium]
MQKREKILVVDDEDDILDILSYNLKEEGYKVKTAHDGIEALEILNGFHPDLILLDIMMPRMDGIELLQTLRNDDKNNDIIIALLTARDESFTQISAFEHGGDDFISKPIKPSVLKARVKALLRRRVVANPVDEIESNTYGSLTIFPDDFKIEIDGQEIALAKKEFELLLLLSSKPGRVFKRSEILNRVWGQDVIVGDRTIDVHIRKLREKIPESMIQTIKGVGYKFEI